MWIIQSAFIHWRCYSCVSSFVLSPELRVYLFSCDRKPSTIFLHNSNSQQSLNQLSKSPQRAHSRPCFSVRLARSAHSIMSTNPTPVCPACSNMLTITRVPNDATGAAPHHFACRTCPYSFPLSKPHYERKYFTHKAAEDVLGGAESNNHREKVEAPCPNEKCDSMEAFFSQMQIRSADEPMTSFFTCVKCRRRWQEN